MAHLQSFPPGMTYPERDSDPLRRLTIERERLARQIEILKPRSRRRIELEQRAKELALQQLHLELRTEKKP